MAMKCIFFSVLLVQTTLANRVSRIEVRTSSCDDCGMGAFGSLEVEICGNGPESCCRGTLDNLFTDDFNPGQVSTFEGDGLGDCNGFELGSGNNWRNFMTVYHEGPDSGKFDWIAMKTDLGVEILCDLFGWMSSGDFQVADNCEPIIKKKQVF